MKTKFSLPKFFSMLSLLEGIELSPNFLSRGHLPNVIDLPNHATNFGFGFLLGNVIGNIAAALYTRLAPEETHTPARMRGVALAAATGVGTLINWVSESRTGARLFHLEAIIGTTDPLDFLYGVGSTAVAGVTAPTPVPEEKPYVREPVTSTPSAMHHAYDYPSFIEHPLRTLPYEE